MALHDISDATWRVGTTLFTALHWFSVVSLTVLAVVVVGIALWFTIRAFIDRFWPVWVYEFPESRDEQAVRHRFKRGDLRRLWGNAIGRSEGRWYLASGWTVERVREMLAAERARERREDYEDYERRPRWSWDSKGHPGFETAMKNVDRVFKFFQWLTVGVAIRTLGYRTGDYTLSAIGWVLILASSTPYIILLGEFFTTRLQVTPDSGGRYFYQRLLMTVVVTLGLTAIFIEYMTHLTEVLSTVQLSK